MCPSVHIELSLKVTSLHLNIGQGVLLANFPQWRHRGTPLKSHNHDSVNLSHGTARAVPPPQGCRNGGRVSPQTQILVTGQKVTWSHLFATNPTDSCHLSLPWGSFPHLSGSIQYTQVTILPVQHRQCHALLITDTFGLSSVSSLLLCSLSWHRTRVTFFYKLLSRPLGVASQWVKWKLDYKALPPGN